MLAAWRQEPAPTATAAPGAGPDYRTVCKTLGLIVGYIAVLEWAGFPIATVGYLYLPALFTIAAASVLMAPLGARTAHRIDVQSLRRLFALLLMALAATMLWRVFA